MNVILVVIMKIPSHLEKRLIIEKCCILHIQQGSCYIFEVTKGQTCIKAKYFCVFLATFANKDCCWFGSSAAMDGFSKEEIATITTSPHPQICA